MRFPTLKEKLHALFEAGALLKALGSIAEIILGIVFLTLRPQTINKIIFFIFGDELTEQPRDPLWNFLFHGFNGVSIELQHFWAAIFIAHGVVIMFLVVGLVRKKLWAYPIAGIAFACLVVYQIYHIAYAPSIILALLTSYDIFFIWLIAQEYQYQHHASSST